MPGNIPPTQLDFLSDLPFEIRIIVWEFAVAQLPPQIVAIECPPSSRNELERPPIMELTEPVVDYQPFGLLWACQLSRAVTLRYFPLLFITMLNGGHGRYVNPTQARLHIEITRTNEHVMDRILDGNTWLRVEFKLFYSLTFWHYDHDSPGRYVVGLNPQPFLSLRDLTVALPPGRAPNPWTYMSHNETERRWISNVQPQQRTLGMPVLEPPKFKIYSYRTKFFRKSRDGRVLAMRRHAHTQRLLQEAPHRREQLFRPHLFFAERLDRWRQRRRDVRDLARRRQQWEYQMRDHPQVVQHTSVVRSVQQAVQHVVQQAVQPLQRTVQPQQQQVHPEQEEVNPAQEEVDYEQEEDDPAPIEFDFEREGIGPMQYFLDPEEEVVQRQPRLELRLPAAGTVGRIAMFGLTQYLFWSSILPS